MITASTMTRPVPVGRAAVGVVSASAPQMGGIVSVHVRPPPQLAAADAEQAARTVVARIGTWARRLTRFDPGSELSVLNAAPDPDVDLGPTMTEVVDWGRGAEILTDGIVDIGLLAERLRAEVGSGKVGDPPLPASRRWSLTRRGRGATIARPVGLMFDFDGIAKGWLADRALALLAGVSAVVDADGDVAGRVVGSQPWFVGVTDPRDPDAFLARLRFDSNGTGMTFGVATSGRSVHRWLVEGRPSHHLIDPRTGRPAATDVVQATVVARTARAAEAFAKTAVIVGTEAALRRLDRPDVLGLILLTEDDTILASPATVELIA